MCRKIVISLFVFFSTTAPGASRTCSREKYEKGNNYFSTHPSLILFALYFGTFGSSKFWYCHWVPISSKTSELRKSNFSVSPKNEKGGPFSKKFRIFFIAFSTFQKILRRSSTKKNFEKKINFFGDCRIFENFLKSYRLSSKNHFLRGKICS